MFRYVYTGNDTLSIYLSIYTLYLEIVVVPYIEIQIVQLIVKLYRHKYHFKK